MKPEEILTEKLDELLNYLKNPAKNYRLVQYETTVEFPVDKNNTMETELTFGRLIHIGTQSIYSPQTGYVETITLGYVENTETGKVIPIPLTELTFV